MKTEVEQLWNFRGHSIELIKDPNNQKLNDWMFLYTTKNSDDWFGEDISDSERVILTAISIVIKALTQSDEKLLFGKFCESENQLLDMVFNVMRQVSAENSLSSIHRVVRWVKRKHSAAAD